MAEQPESTNGSQVKAFTDPLTGKTYERATFASEVRGTEAKPIDFTMAKLAQDSYKSHVPDRPPIDGWTALTEQQLLKVGIDPKLMHDKKSGYDAAIYTDNDGRYVVAFRGTDQAKDWKTNLGQGAGFSTSQYNLAAELGTKSKAAFGENVAFVGHSLGGGLAAIAMASTTEKGQPGVPGMTFNAAGLTNATMREHGLDPAAIKREAENGQVRNYQVKGEILTHVQEKNILTSALAANAIGRDMPLPDPNPLTGMDRFNPKARVEHRVELHLMDAVLDAWQMKHGQLLGNNQPAQGQPSLQDRAHPANDRFETIYGNLAPKLDKLGLTAEEARAVSADLTKQTLIDGVNPARADIGKDQLRAFAIPDSDTKPYSQVVIGESKDKSLTDISRDSAALVAANPALVASNDTQVRGQPAPDQANPEIGGLAAARGGR